MLIDDHVGSDDLGEVLEMSRREYQRTRPVVNGSSSSGSRSVGVSNPIVASIRQEIRELDREIEEYTVEERELRARLAELAKMKSASIVTRTAKATQLDDFASGGSSRGGKRGIDYQHDEFEWTAAVLTTMKNVFGISSFRLCQQGVVNACMEGRDVVCIMPTGGGKSLTYQLPAIMASGTTLVISPLLSLISDQIMHLKEAKINAVKLTGSTSKEESQEISQQLSKSTDGSREIKLCYVTPEKIAKSKAFVSILSKMNEDKRLARIVIDEAHCVSQLGHDFRPDYQKLRVLRQLFPRVPISAVSATCPPKVLNDLVQTLGLKPVVDGNCADMNGTVYFSAPLYRKNLHYSVVTKHSQGDRVTEAMTQYILDNHFNETGIVYCLLKRDAETVATELQKKSEGKIRTGVYHSEKHDSEKEHLHKQWRSGAIQVVCATIAFGLGIDKADVRFVLHHSLSKSLDGFYQESGRAGRDGKDSDCVLYYRPQDLSQLSAMTISEKDSRSKLHSMLRFVQDLETCRKIQFAKYFSSSTQMSLSSWGTEESGALDCCGHCDNCTRDLEMLEERDVTFETWQILQILNETLRMKHDLTLAMVASVARGNRVGTKGKEKEVDHSTLCGGKVDMKREDLERLLVHLLLEQYLADYYKTTAYNTVAYLKVGVFGSRFMRLPMDSVKAGNSQFKISLMFEKRTKPKQPRRSGSGASQEPASTAAKRRKSVVVTEASTSQPVVTKRRKLSSEEAVAEKRDVIFLSDSEEEILDWEFNMRDKGSRSSSARRSVPVAEDDDDDGIEFLS